VHPNPLFQQAYAFTDPKLPFVPIQSFHALIRIAGWQENEALLERNNPLAKDIILRA